MDGGGTSVWGALSMEGLRISAGEAHLRYQSDFSTHYMALWTKNGREKNGLMCFQLSHSVISGISPR